MPTKRDLPPALLLVFSIAACKPGPDDIETPKPVTRDVLVEQIRNVGFEPLLLPQSRELTGRVLKLESPEGEPVRFTVRCSPTSEAMLERGNGPQLIEASAGRGASQAANIGVLTYAGIFGEHKEVTGIRMQLTDLKLTTVTIDGRRQLNFSEDCLEAIEEDLAAGHRVAVVKGSLAGNANIRFDYAKGVSAGVRAQITQQVSAQYQQGVALQEDGTYVLENLVWGLKLETENTKALCVGFGALEGRCKEAFRSAAAQG